MAKTTREIVMELILKDEQFRKEVKKASGQVKKVGDATEKTTKKSVGLFKKLRLGWMAIAAAVTIALRSIVRFTKTAVKASAENTVAQIKFQKVFRGSIKVATEYRKELTKSFAMSGTAATMMLSKVQDLLVPMGLMREKAAVLSGTVIKLAADIGAFNEKPTEAIIEAIQSAMVGMNRPMMQYGVVLSAATVKQEAFNMGLHDGTGELTAAAKAQATLSLIAKGSTDAMGAFAEQSNTWSVMMKNLRARLEDIVNVIGDKFVAAFRPALAALVEFVGHEDTIDGIGSAFERIGKVLGGTLKWILDIVGAFQAIKSWLDRLNKAIRRVGNTSEQQLQKVMDLNVEERLGELKKLHAKILEEETKLAKKVSEKASVWETIAWGQRLSARYEIEKEIARLEKEATANQAQEMRERTKQTERMREREAELAQQSAEDQRAALEAKRLQEEDDHQRRLADAERHWGEVEAANELRRMSEVAAERKKNKKIFDAAVKFGKQGLTFAKNFAKQESDARIAQIERRVNSGVLTEAEGQKAIRKEKRKAFNQSKQFAIAENIINGALAISKAFAQLGPIFGAVAAIPLAAMTIAKTALISKQKAPEYAEGGIAGLRGPELISVGERGPELVIPNKLLAAAAGGGDINNALNLGPESVIINISGPTAASEEGIKDAVYAGMRQVSDDFGQGNKYRG